MEVDDGTSAWGDPSGYNYKNVNLWDKNTPRVGDPSDQQAHGPPQHLPAHAAPGPENGGGSSSSSWGEPPPPPTTVDNGTSAWGKPVDTGASWGDSIGDAGGTANWGSLPASQPAPNKADPRVCLAELARLV
uniref:Uncharacterized protein n=1 Tax=Sphaerodactylus townsendi TaxID=933632 RepID=A0ACB8FK96_9SAUR